MHYRTSLLNVGLVLIANLMSSSAVELKCVADSVGGPVRSKKSTILNLQSCVLAQRF
jgi:hypothetical protein